MFHHPASVFREAGCVTFGALPASCTVRNGEQEASIARHERWWSASVSTSYRKACVIEFPVIIGSKMVDGTFGIPDSRTVHGEHRTSPTADTGVTPDFPHLSAVRKAMSGSTAGVSGSMP